MTADCPPLPAAGSGRRRSPVLLVLLVGLAVHLPALHCGYVYDDVEAVLEDPDLRQWGRAPGLFVSSYWGERGIGLYRPLVRLGYLLEGASLGFQPGVSHLVGVLLHLLAVGLLFRLLVRLGLREGTAAVAALLVALTPATLSARVWVSGRTDVQAAVFVLGGLLAALRAGDRDEGPLGACTVGLGVFFLLGLLSKEMAATLPFIVLLLPGAGHHRRLPVQLLVLGLYLVLRAVAVEGFLPAGAGDGEGVVLRDQNVLQRLAIGARACLRLLGTAVVPLGLAGDHRGHPWAQPDAEVGATGFLALVLLFGGAAAAWRRRRRAPAEGFLWCAGVVALLPLLQIVPIGAVMAERFIYLPVLFLMPALVRAIGRGLARRAPALGPLLVLLAAAGFTAVTLHRIPVYEDRRTFFSDVVSAYPDDHRAWNNLGVARYLPLEGYEDHAPDYATADRAFARALRHRPRYRRALLNRSRALLERQRRRDPGTALDPIEDWLGDLAARDDPDALYLLGKVSWRRAGRAAGPAAGDRHLERAWDRHRRAAGGFVARGADGLAAAAWKEAGLAARELRDRDRLHEAFRHALALDPAIREAAAMRRTLAR